MSATAWALLAAMLLLDTVSHLALKSATERAQRDPRDMHFLRILVRNPVFWAAIAVFLAMMVAWIGFYSVVPLGQGVLAGCITIAGVMLGGRICFGERITPARALAAAMIALGVLLVGGAQP